MINTLKNTILSSSGFCPACKETHSLEATAAVEHCKNLMAELDVQGRIDLNVPMENADPELSTDYLMGKARGQMFGIMVYHDSDGHEGTARAFSGQYNGRWEIPGWVQPIIDVEEFDELTKTTERRIKMIGRHMAQLPQGSAQHAELALSRKELSRHLMREIHSIYRIHNFKGEVRPMPEIVNTQKGIPTGTGDCCAPKLLNHAARNGLRPISIAEFYYGRENRSGTRSHKHFYPSCTDKCGLILGFMLCGLAEK